MKFEIGDKVVCINNGNEYTIEGSYEEISMIKGMHVYYFLEELNYCISEDDLFKVEPELIYLSTYKGNVRTNEIQKLVKELEERTERLLKSFDDLINSYSP